MLRNHDGTLYQLESVFETIDLRARRQDFPDCSDMLGSDWAFGLPAPKSPAHYVEQAKAVARGRPYPNIYNQV